MLSKKILRQGLIKMEAAQRINPHWSSSLRGVLKSMILRSHFKRIKASSLRRIFRRKEYSRQVRKSQKKKVSVEKSRQATHHRAEPLEDLGNRLLSKKAHQKQLTRLYYHPA